MALYLRWLDLKNGKTNREIKKDPIQPEETLDDIDLQFIRQDLNDMSKPIELQSDAMIRYVIEDSVKKHFNAIMAEKMMHSLEK